MDWQKCMSKIAKHILQKVKDTNEDSHLAMMVYQTTPLGPDLPRPMEILYGCKAQSDLPLANAALKAKGLIQTVVESTKNQQNTDKNPLKEGQPVMFKTPPEKTWRKVAVLKYLGHRSHKYVLKTTLYTDAQGFIWNHTIYSQHKPHLHHC